MEAVGSRGEACIVLCVEVELKNGTTELHYSLATGERLRPVDVESDFETLDGRRRFTLR